MNGNIHYQLFCGIQIDSLYPLRNYKIVSAIRQKLAGKLDIEALLGVLVAHWRPYLENKQVCMTDATCYESYLRFPTDMKLLGKSFEWLYQHICRQCRSLCLRPSYLAYSKKRKRKASRSRLLKGDCSIY